MRTEWLSIPLEDLGMLRVQGPDATRFLQGQLSNDIVRLSSERSLLAGYHNPQGRAIALLRLVWLGAEDFLAVLPRELVAAVAVRLSKFVLRAKVKIADQSAHWLAAGLVGPDSTEDVQPRAIVQTSGLTLASNLNGQTVQGSQVLVRVGSAPSRWLTLSPTDSPVNESPDAPRLVPGSRELWRLLDIAAGQPQIYAATSEEFVAQMLNLDLLDAIAFDKGCYTGQEVIARAHYRGRVKRRLQRLVTAGRAELAPGSSGALEDGRAFKVIEAAQRDDGRCEFLAVAPISAAAADSSDGERIEAEQLALPYSLPE